MGDPKKPRKGYSRPRSPWRTDQLAQELYLLGNFGLRNKRELWKAQTNLSSVRKQTRTLLAATQVVRQREEKKFMDSLKRRGLVGEDAILDTVLNVTVEDVLSRRLQTMVFKRGMAVSPLHARQLISHGHVAIGERVITIPGYEVGAKEEDAIKLIGAKEAASAPAVASAQSEPAPAAAEVPAAGEAPASEETAPAQ